MHQSKRVILIKIISLLALMPALANAQMFSAGSEQFPTNNHPPQFNAFAGVEVVNLKFRGNPIVEGANIAPESTDIYAFKGSAIRFGIVLPVIKLYGAVGGRATGLDDRSYFNGGVRLGYGLDLYRARRFAFYIPLQIHGTFTSVDNENISPSLIPLFRLGTFEGALGAGARFTPAQNFRITARLLPSFGYSFSSTDRNRGGTVFEARGQLHLFFDHLFGRAGLSLGYAYTFRQFNLDGEFLDYRSLGNDFLIGITF